MTPNDGSPFLVLDQPCGPAIEAMTKQIGRTGFRVVRTFDLQIARHTQAICPCPHHGTAHCDCQMVVLLVYHGQAQPVSIVVHGHNNQTWFSIIDTPQQPADPHLHTAIRQALVTSLP